MTDISKDTQLLLRYVEEDFGIQGSGNWYRAVDHDSLVIDVEGGVFFWNSRNIFGGPLDYLTKVRKLNYLDAKSLLYQRPAIIPTPNNDIPEYKPYENLVNLFYENGLSKRDYWYARLLTDETISKYSLGYYNGWYTLPIYEDGELKNIQLRRDFPDKKIRPYYKGTPVLFNIDNTINKNTIVLCEGIVDCMLLDQLGIPAVSKFGGASTWLSEWFPYFIGNKTIYLVFDNDDAGRNGAKRIAENLGNYKSKIYTFDGFGDRYDIVDFFRDGGTVEKFEYLLANESKYSFEV